MRADELVVGQSYAWVRYSIGHPQRAKVLEEPSRGDVKVQIVHPDLGGEEFIVGTRELANGWYSEPDIDRFGGFPLAQRVREAREAGSPLTWKAIADQAYEHVQRSRALADRLTALGIPRAHEHYAGKGGSNNMQAKIQLVLNHNELEFLIAQAEASPVRPTRQQVLGTVDT